MTAGPSLGVLSDVRDLGRLLDIPFSAEQRAAITAPLEPGVIVAGAGSGKTTVMAARVVWLVGTGQVQPAEVLGLTFTTKAAAELASGVRSRLQALAARSGQPYVLEQLGEPVVSTYHAYAGGLLVEHGLRLGFEPDLRVVADASRYQLAARAIASFSGVREHLSISLPTLIGQVIRLDNELSDHLVELDEVRRFDADLRDRLAEEPQIAEVKDAVTATKVRDELLDLVAAYRDAKADAGVTEFADQMGRAARLAEASAAVGELERGRYRVVLLDEYQDTSVSQRRMLQGLFSGPTAATGRGHPVTAVGDPCQAIYGWRGASVDNIDGFGAHFPRSDGTPAPRLTLSVNRRCARDVLAAANDVAEELYALHAGVEPLVPRAEAGAGRIRVALHETVADEVAAVVDDVERLGASFAREPGTSGWSDIAILVRDGNERAALAAGLRSRGVPVEVVGLSGLLTTPEVADVVATLRCISSLTANAALLRLLAGPRWRVGPRDLALLGARARLLAAADRSAAGDLQSRLDLAVTGVDSTEVVSLSDALDHPGAADYSAAARTRFTALSAELTALRRAAGDPLVDLVRRVVEVLGIDVELAADGGPQAQLARDNLALFVDAVGDFAGTDPTAGLFGLLAYLDAELEHDRGMEVAEPGGDDSVKLLTVHSAKGLEWRAVLLPFLSSKVFPSEQPRPRWERNAAVVPVPLRGDRDALPRQASWSKADRDAYRRDCRRQQALEERRLGYVAVTRAKELVLASGHWWGRTQQKPRGPSPYLEALRAHAAVADGGTADPAATDAADAADAADAPDVASRWAPGPVDGATNPMVDRRQDVAFPGSLDTDRIARRRAVAADVRQALADGVDAAEGVPAAVSAAVSDELAVIDAELETLLAEAQRRADASPVVDLPATLSATRALRLGAEPERLAAELARPMPRRPSAAARLGTRFHAWVEASFGQQQLIDADELPGRADADIDDEADLRSLVDAFRRGPFADRVPAALEAPFQLVLGGHVVVGRIDAVFVRPDGGFDVVDWKTSRHEDADPTQLALYRLAWAELQGVALEQVGAAFCYVRTGRVVRPDALPDRGQLEAELFGQLA